MSTSGSICYCRQEAFLCGYLRQCHAEILHGGDFSMRKKRVPVKSSGSCTQVRSTRMCTAARQQQVVKPYRLACDMRDYFQANRRENVGMLHQGNMPHEQYMREYGITTCSHPFLSAFNALLLHYQPLYRVSGAQAYRHLRIAVLGTFNNVDQLCWPDIAI